MTVRISAISGNRVWTTYYGGEGRESIGMLALDMVDDLYVSGSTNSTAGIATLGSHQPQLAGAYDGFFGKV